jgi:hypothetical protein
VLQEEASAPRQHQDAKQPKPLMRRDNVLLDAPPLSAALAVRRVAVTHPCHLEDASRWRAAVLQRQRTGRYDPDRQGLPSLPQDRQGDARQLATHEVWVRLVGPMARRQRQLGCERLYLRLDVRELEVIGREQRFQLVELPMDADARTP